MNRDPAERTRRASPARFPHRRVIRAPPSPV